MKTMLTTAFLLSACHGGSSSDQTGPSPADTDTDSDADTDTDTDADTDTDTGPAPDAVWNLPDETPPTALEAIWVGRFADDGDFPFSAAYLEPDGTSRAMVLSDGVDDEPYAASVIVIAVDYPDPCKALTLAVEATNTAGDLIDAGDLPGAAAVLQQANAVATPEDFWSMSAGYASDSLAGMDSWELTDLGRYARSIPFGAGVAYHQRQDRNYEALLEPGSDPYVDEDGWVMSGALAMTALDRAAGTMSLTGTVDLRRCPPYAPGSGFSPCMAPSGAPTEGSVALTLTASRCESLEDALSFFW